MYFQANRSASLASFGYFLAGNDKRGKQDDETLCLWVLEERDFAGDRHARK